MEAGAAKQGGQGTRKVLGRGRRGGGDADGSRHPARAAARRRRDVSGDGSIANRCREAGSGEVRLARPGRRDRRSPGRPRTRGSTAPSGARSRRRSRTGRETEQRRGSTFGKGSRAGRRGRWRRGRRRSSERRAEPTPRPGDRKIEGSVPATASFGRSAAGARTTWARIASLRAGGKRTAGSRDGGEGGRPKGRPLFRVGRTPAAALASRRPSAAGGAAKPNPSDARTRLRRGAAET